jgi:adenylylsulfate kinase
MENKMNKNLTAHGFTVSRKQRQSLNQDNHKGMVIWFTGLSGSGKSTLANAIDKNLNDIGFQTYLLDGDNIRMGLNKDLGFSPDDRKENIRRIAETAKLFADSGKIVITAFISPYEEDRKMARNIIGEDYLEIFLDVPLHVCEARDPKGLYKKARSGEIKGFTGIDAPYERPNDSEIHQIMNENDQGIDGHKLTKYLMKLTNKFKQ